jgi:transcription-repair coupling factor (superfamily II helicase)
VVHIEHGIGLFQSLTKLTVDGSEREYLQVDYAAGDKLYVPIHQVDRLSRYVGVGDRPPVVHRLGTTDWARVKARAERAVEDIARDLLELYSAREVIPGHAFSPDTPWQAELEAAFPYIETKDQLAAVEAVKTDMEQVNPMDRLICGDVGYGKTEVALRAAFKAVMDGKQVALLVPTTVLAQQHHQTFLERLKPFPVEVEMLSRFRSRREQQRVLERLRKGQVDIVIGTHRLLQKDVVFKDLGLLIIDEEQRFGVTHKEKLKQMRKEVDVLTLTATPIPRTLHMSLMGVRDMSTIETPPEERLPIVTHVGEYDESLIRKAILRELARGGQVYFVHNRVQGINQMAQRLTKIVPEATLSIGHGQMPERELERVMLDFGAGEVDVLVCTSIIQNGLDIPNANTIIVNRADRFGLAQRPAPAAERDSPQALADYTGGQRTGSGVPHCHARPGDPGGGGAPGRSPARPHRCRGLRPLLSYAGPGCAGVEGRGAQPTAGGGNGLSAAPSQRGANQPAPGRLSAGGLCARREAALASVPPLGRLEHSG